MNDLVKGLGTLCVHAGYDASSDVAGAATVPIYQTAAYVFKDGRHAAALFNLDEEGHIYSRISNPTVEVFEKRMAALEGGKAAVALSSGMAAIFSTILNLASAGDEIISSPNLYGGTYTLFSIDLPKLGIEVKFAPTTAVEDVEKLITPRTRALYAEVIGNPRLDVLDIEAWAKLAHKHRVPLVLDSTFATPYLCRPFEFGADIVIHSTTKFIGGHGLVIGGIVVDSGRFDWKAGRFKQFCEPEPAYHDIRFTDRFEAPFAARLRSILVRDLGACMAPFNAFLLLLGLETLHLRMERHCANAKAIAEFLASHPKVSWVNYPGLKGSPYHDLCEKYFNGKGGAMLTFGMKGGKDASARTVDRLRLAKHLANLGDARTLVIQPATTTHQQLTAQEQEMAGVTPDMIRVSAGIEDTEDILRDFEQALA
ncbi:MAG TPA: O-acetylhomoserine aminocarboxypropyltransferase/cysteine synthase [Firmicutes bacterium]|nr:O-acetylhomoserine aminocarboxypropyltransferase/cysteine synthase [Bacillota bacterium]